MSDAPCVWNGRNLYQVFAELGEHVESVTHSKVDELLCIVELDDGRYRLPLGTIVECRGSTIGFVPPPGEVVDWQDAGGYGRGEPGKSIAVTLVNSTRPPPPNG